MKMFKILKNIKYIKKQVSNLLYTKLLFTIINYSIKYT